MANLKAQIAMAMVIVGCCSNVIFLELLVKQDPGIGNLVTFSQFLLLSVEGFIFTTKFGSIPPKVPLNAWIIMVAFYFLVSVTNNYALNFNIPMPLHMIFRAGSLIANMIMGIILLNKRYTTTKYLSVVMVSVGITLCTIMSASNKPVVDSASQDEHYQFWMLVGVGFLTFALFMSARMGIYQEVVYGKYGKHPKEALFYSHALPLPGFLFLATDLFHHFSICLNSYPITIPVINLAVPNMMLWLLGNIITQWICINNVFILTSECASLTVTLVVTVRKFLSLLFSIWYFQNPFTIVHWLGTFLVFGGTIIFSDIPGMIKKQQEKKEELEEKKTT
jgi:UDP-xylose/UDP-N-acetylglucosamine transporter B4